MLPTFAMQTRFSIELPEWLTDLLSRGVPVLPTVAEQMQFAIGLARGNVAAGTGGPFAAVVCSVDDGALVSAGVNLVVASGLSVAHAEVVALSLAQKALGDFDLSQRGRRACRLVTTAEPCWMCLGAIHWSGVRAVATGARHADVQAIGFDEGHKLTDWVAELRARGIAVDRDVLRHESVAVLTAYQQSGGVIYNAGRMEA